MIVLVFRVVKNALDRTSAYSKFEHSGVGVEVGLDQRGKGGKLGRFDPCAIRSVGKFWDEVIENIDILFFLEWQGGLEDDTLDVIANNLLLRLLLGVGMRYDQIGIDARRSQLGDIRLCLLCRGYSQQEVVICIGER